LAHLIHKASLRVFRLTPLHALAFALIRRNASLRFWTRCRDLSRAKALPNLGCKQLLGVTDLIFPLIDLTYSKQNLRTRTIAVHWAYQKFFNHGAFWSTKRYIMRWMPNKLNVHPKLLLNCYNKKPQRVRLASLEKLVPFDAHTPRSIQIAIHQGHSGHSCGQWSEFLQLWNFWFAWAW
jgi:hypothetical protein